MFNPVVPGWDVTSLFQIDWIYLTRLAEFSKAADFSFVLPDLYRLSKSSGVISSASFFNISDASLLLNNVLPANLDLFLNQSDKSSPFFILDKSVLFESN